LIYLDTSAALASILAEPRAPPAALWRDRVVSSRLLEYEIWNRLHARGLARSHGPEARHLIEQVSLIELTPPTLSRALYPFPVALRTLDALHLATLDFLRSDNPGIELASYDRRLSAAAAALGIAIYAL
jgi:predicted nucleic acid-binding protein